MNSNYKGMRAGFATVTTLFFMWGFITVSIDPLIAALKAIFELSYARGDAHAVRVLHGVFRRVAAGRGADRAARQQQVDHVRARRHGASAASSCRPPRTSTPIRWCSWRCSSSRAASPSCRWSPIRWPRHLGRRSARTSGSRSRRRSTRSARGSRRSSCRGVILAGGIFAVTHGAEITPELRAESFRKIDRVFLAIAGALVLLALFIFVFRKLLDVTKPVDEGQRPSVATALKSPLGGVRRDRDLPVRRRRSIDRQRHDQFPARARHARTFRSRKRERW